MYSNDKLSFLIDHMCPNTLVNRYVDLSSAGMNMFTGPLYNHSLRLLLSTFNFADASYTI